MSEKLEVKQRFKLQKRQSTPNGSMNFLGDNGGVNIRVSHVRVNRSLEFVARNYTQPFNLVKLVEISQMSRRGFVKAFINHTGMRPGHFLRQIRIAQSKRLLIENDLRLTEIAAMSGFEKLNSFCVAFKRETGVAPKKFQRQAWLKYIKNNLKNQKTGQSEN